MTDSTAPATKADISGVMDAIDRLYDAEERWKDEILASNKRCKNEILIAIERWNWKEQLKEDFRLVIENLRHDLLGARHELLDDRTQRLEKRVTRLEVRAGF